MSKDLRPCPTCGQLVPFDGDCPAVVCFGPVYKFRANSRHTLGRYGKLLWYHATPRLMAELEDEEIDPRALKPLDIRIVNAIRSRITKRFPALVAKDPIGRIIP